MSAAPLSSGPGIASGPSGVLKSESVTKHAAGPWGYVSRLSGSENHRGFRVYGADGYYFAEVMPGDEDGKQGAANANLIAASPDMLAFAQGFIDWLETIRKVREPKQMLPGIEAQERAARAAISKAGGAA